MKPRKIPARSELSMMYVVDLSNFPWSNMCCVAHTEDSKVTAKKMFSRSPNSGTVKWRNHVSKNPDKGPRTLLTRL